MEQLAAKENSSLIIFFSFILLLSETLGSFAFKVAKDLISHQILTSIVFTINGVTLFLYAYMFQPRTRELLLDPGLVNKVWGCFVSALLNKRKASSKLKRRSWLDYADGKYDKMYVAKSKKLLKLCSMILPTAGFMLFSNTSEDIFREFWSHLKLRGKDVPKIISWSVEAVLPLMMICMEKGTFSLLTYMGYKMNFHKRFIIGYIGMLVAIFFAAISLAHTEKVQLTSNLGMVRIYNDRLTPIELRSEDLAFSSLNFTVKPNSAVMANYYTNEQRLFKVTVYFETDQWYTINLSVTPNALTSYIVVDPPDIFRVRGYVPLKEGPPGNNSRNMPRCFVASFMRDQTNMTLQLKSLDGKSKYRLRNISPGSVKVFQVEEGNYKISIQRTSVEIIASFLIGGVYGIFMYTDLHDYQLILDQIVPENTSPAFTGLGVNVPLGIAFGAEIALNAFVYINAPEGLIGISVGFFKSVENFTCLILLLGFYTWHPYVTSHTLTFYSFGAATCFFLCLVLLIKYRHNYVF